MQTVSEVQNTASNLFFKFYDEVSPVRKWTKKEYHKLAELGFFDNMRVEFMDGEIIVNTDYEIVRKGEDLIMTMNNPHAVAIRLILAVLHKIFDENYLIDSQLPLNFGDDAEPEPDIAVIQGNPRDFIESHPQNATLIIEVSDTTLYYDRNRKASLYAKFLIQDYWVLNLKNRKLEVYRSPMEDENAYYGFSFSEKQTFSETDEVSPLAKSDARIKVADLLP
jgi:Putative restriction endonuclease